MLQHASTATDGVVASQAARALSLLAQARNSECHVTADFTCKIVIPYFGTVVFGPGKDYRRPKGTAHTPSSYAPSPGLPTPAESYSGSSYDIAPPANDPFVSFESYLAQMPFDFNLADQAVQQPASGFNDYNDAIANVNLDLDQDWAWYPVQSQY